MKNLYHFLVIHSLLLGAISSARAEDVACTPDEAARYAQILGRAHEAGTSIAFHELKDNHFLAELGLTPDQMKLVNDTAASMGFNTQGATNLKDAINAVAKEIATKPISDIDKSELMSQWADKLNEPLIKTLSTSKRKTVNFAFGMAVGRLNEFPESQWVQSALPIHGRGAAGAADFDDYLKHTTAYLRGDNSMIVQTGVVSGDTIRQAEVNMRWVLGINHDMTHVHYATSHPRMVAAFFTAQKAQNNLRAILMGQAYESVDTVQYSQERALADYFKNDLHMDIEEGLTYISRATQKELDRISQKIGNGSTTGAHAGWDFRPQIYDFERERKADDEINAMIEKFSGYLSSDDPDAVRARHYHRTGSAADANLNDESKQGGGTRDAAVPADPAAVPIDPVPPAPAAPVVDPAAPAAAPTSPAATPAAAPAQP